MEPFELSKAHSTPKGLSIHKMYTQTWSRRPNVRQESIIQKLQYLQRNVIVSSAQKWQNRRRPIKFIGSCDTVMETTGLLNAHFAAAIKQQFNGENII